MTLTEAAADDPNRGDALYHIFEKGVMTGSVDSRRGSNLRLSFPPSTPPDSAPS